MSSSSEASDGCRECIVTCTGYGEKKRIVTDVWRAEDPGNILQCDPFKPIDPNKTVYYWHIDFDDYGTLILNRNCDKNLSGPAAFYLEEGVTTELNMALSSQMTQILGGCTDDPNYVPDIQVGEIWTASMTFEARILTYKQDGTSVCPPPFVVVTPGTITVEKDRV
jgi:hypothetical protein